MRFESIGDSGRALVDLGVLEEGSHLPDQLTA